MGLPDASQSRAVLIGSSAFATPQLTDLPGVRNNVADLRQLLMHGDGMALSSDQCVATLDPSREVLSRAVREAATAASDTFVVYYAGHGAISPHDGQLYLTLPDTDPGDLGLTAIPYKELRAHLYDAKAQRRIMILDCCFSGRATAVMSDPSSLVTGQISVAGCHTLASTTANEPAQAPPGEQYTAFTGELIELLRNGTAEAGEFLTLDAVYHSLVRAMATRGLARPQRLGTGTAERIALARNPRYRPRPEVEVDESEPVASSGDLTDLVAHGPNEQGQWHSLRQHALSTAELAAEFAQPWEGSRLAYALGVFHDAGKAYPHWQQRLREVVGTGQRVGRHEELGARLLKNAAGRAALAVLGHHHGLSDVGTLKKVMRGSAPEHEMLARQRFFAAIPEAQDIAGGASLVPDSWTSDPLLYEMGLRMTFSALVDADRLDAAAHDNAVRPEPERSVDMAGLVERFERRRGQKLAAAIPTPMDAIRREVYETATSGAKKPPGIYRLAAPTGSGKTLAQGGFALHHAAAWGFRRVVIAMPLITVTEQNARTYREVLDGPDPVVLEHHSQVGLDSEEEVQQAEWTRTASENWDAPVVLTTTVQLFETLFGRTPAQLRKLHRLANSVLVLDEVQALPSRLLLPILDGLRLLVEHFGVTVLLTSATQPTFEHLSPWQRLTGQTAPTDLLEDVPDLFKRSRRVVYEWRLQPQPMLEDVADEVRADHQALVVVNSTADARRLYRTVARHRSDVVHLSSRMYPRHRMRQLAVVRELLDRGESVVLVATQLVEAGVDISFPVVWRALAPADSLQQAAGRAGRHGDITARVIVFDPVDGGAPQEYATQVDVTRAYFGPGLADPDNVDALREYYDEVYRRLGVDLTTTREQRNRHAGQVIQEHRRALDYRSVVEGPVRNASARAGGRNARHAFRMIPDRSVPVVVIDVDDEDVASVHSLVEQVREQTAPVRDLVRALQGWVVQMPRWLLSRLEQDCVQWLSDELACWVGPYDAMVGIDDDVVAPATPTQVQAADTPSRARSAEQL